MRSAAAGSPPAGSVAELLRPAAQLVEVGVIGKRSGHGVFLLRLRSAAQAEGRGQQPVRGDAEVDSVLPADPVAPSSANFTIAPSDLFGISQRDSLTEVRFY